MMSSYGEETALMSQRKLFPTLTIPSPILRQHNMEILISTIHTHADSSTSKRVVKSRDAILVPSLETPASENGRFSVVKYPVHKALVFGEGPHSCVAFGKYMAATNDGDLPTDAIKVALDVPGTKLSRSGDTDGQCVIVNTNLGSAALAKFRESVENVTAYERDWFKSGIVALTEWLAQGLESTDVGVMPTVHGLIESLLDDTLEQIAAESAERLRMHISSSVPDSTRKALQEDLTIWAERAHTELRDQLEVAFAGRRWQKLGWWKLFWRVDDVGMIATEILERRYLVEAEKEMIYLSGRVEEAGFFRCPAALDDSSAYFKPLEQDPPRQWGRPPPVTKLAEGVIRKELLEEDPTIKLPPPRPWPTHIPISRSFLSTASVPSMQSLAQKLVLQALTGSSISAAFGALVYVANSSAPLYEAGAIFSFGIVWTLQRFQKKWEKARKDWESEVREEGRKSIQEIEGVMRATLRDLGKGDEMSEGSEEREVAGDAVARAKEALHALEGGK
jgi:hypothetical protein